MKERQESSMGLDLMGLLEKLCWLFEQAVLSFFRRGGSKS